jgi:hypothetical protein
MEERGKGMYIYGDRYHHVLKHEPVKSYADASEHEFGFQ